jgi:hypothetical protein
MNICFKNVSTKIAENTTDEQKIITIFSGGRIAALIGADQRMFSKLWSFETQCCCIPQFSELSGRT